MAMLSIPLDRNAALAYMLTRGFTGLRSTGVSQARLTFLSAASDTTMLQDHIYYLFKNWIH